MVELGKMLKKEKQRGKWVIPEITSVGFGKSCSVCCFNELESCFGIKCTSGDRKDGNTVIFHEVE